MITSRDYTGALCKLLHNGRVIAPGEQVETFRGTLVTVTGGEAPQKPGSSGRVFTTYGEYFPGVVNAEWVLA
jgi:hypothetical protein